MMERQDTTVTLEETAVQDLTSRLRGTLLRHGDAGYEETRPGLQRHDRQAPGADRAVRGRGRRDRGGQLCPREEAAPGGARRRAQRPGPRRLR